MFVTVARRHAERGQTIPFWAFAILMSMSLVFFVYNYSNAVRYQIRAQNASDSAATAALAGDAARLNSVQTLLMALNVQEFKTRNIIAAVPGLLTGGDTNCSGASGILASNCVSDLANAVGDVQGEVTNLTNVSTALDSFSGQLTGNNLSNIPGTVSSFFTNNCVALSTDCAFKYTTIVSLVNGLPVVDEYACETVPTFESSFMPNAPKTYHAIGHTTYALAPLAANLNAANGEGGLVNSVLVDNINEFPNIGGTAITGNFANLNLGTGYYSTIPVTTAQAPRSASSVC